MSVGEMPIQNFTGIAGADLSSNQYYAVKLDTTTGNVVLAAAGDAAIGILQNNPSLTKPVSQVMVLGQSFAVYGATVTPGQNLSVGTGGKLIPTVGSAAVVAVSVDGGSANETHTVLLVAKTSAGNNQYSIMNIPVVLKNIAAADLVTTYTPGFAGSIVKMSFLVTDPATTASKAATLTPKIGSTALTGGVLALTSANCTPLGKVNDATAITGGNTFGATDTISITGSSVTAFAEGAGVLMIVMQC